jgi:hypothetical protein
MMKRKIFIVIFLAKITIGLFAQSDFYYTDKGEKETFKIRKDKVILKTKSEAIAKTLSKDAIFHTAYNMHDWVIASIDTLQIKLDGLLMQRTDIVDAAYALEYSNDAFYYSTGQIAVKLKKGYSIEKLLNETGLNKNIESIELFDTYSELYVINLNVKLGEILQVSRSLYETGLFEIAAPSLMWEIKPSNTYYSNQWGLKNTGQSGGTLGIDIKAEQAWQITRGSAEIRVAVI